MDAPYKTKNKIAILSSNPMPDHIATQNSHPRRYRHQYVLKSAIHNSQDYFTYFWETSEIEPI